MEDNREQKEDLIVDSEQSFQVNIGPIQDDDLPCTPPGTPPGRKRKRSQSPVPSDQKRMREHDNRRDMNTSEHERRRSSESHSEHRHHGADRDHNRDYDKRPPRDNRRFDERRPPEHERRRIDENRVYAGRNERGYGDRKFDARGGNFDDRSRIYERRTDGAGRFDERGFDERRFDQKREDPRMYNERRFGDDRRMDDKRMDGRRFLDRRMEDDRGPQERRHAPLNTGIEKSIYVGNLPYDIHRDELKRLCEKFGTVYAITLGAKGYGFVTMDERGAFLAVRELDGKTFDGRTLHVNEAFNEPKLLP